MQETINEGSNSATLSCKVFFGMGVWTILVKASQGFRIYL
jgi:hypothetical protein